MQVPSGLAVHGWMFWLVGLALTLGGVGALVSGRVVLGVALLAGGALLVLQTFVSDSPSGR